MSADNVATLVKLSDSEQVLADPNDDIRGRKVYDRDGNQIGKVDDLLIDTDEHKVRFLRVEHGGFLGLGGTPSFVPVDAVTGVAADAVRIKETGERVSGAPRYEPEVVESKDDESSYYHGLYGYYGYTPFWAPGYMYPGYPYARH